MTHVTCRLTAENRDRLRNPTLISRVWTTFTFYLMMMICLQCFDAVGLAIRYNTRCYFNVRSKADISQLNLPHGTDN